MNSYKPVSLLICSGEGPDRKIIAQSLADDSTVTVGYVVGDGLQLAQHVKLDVLLAENARKDEIIARLRMDRASLMELLKHK